MNCLLLIAWALGFSAAVVIGTWVYKAHDLAIALVIGALSFVAMAKLAYIGIVHFGARLSGSLDPKSKPQAGRKEKR